MFYCRVLSNITIIINITIAVTNPTVMMRNGNPHDVGMIFANDPSIVISVNIQYITHATNAQFNSFCIIVRINL